MDAATVMFLEGLALRRLCPSIAMLHRLTTAEALRRGAPAPSYSTVREIVQALDPALATLALEGPRVAQGPARTRLRRRADRPQNFNIDIGAWKKTDRYPSVIAKHKTTGHIYLYTNPSGRTPAAGVQIGNGWQQLEINLLDWNRGDTDIVARHAGGQLFLYRTNGSGSFLNERRPSSAAVGRISRPSQSFANSTVQVPAAS